jgi:hypothetical protein
MLLAGPPRAATNYLWDVGSATHGAPDITDLRGRLGSGVLSFRLDKRDSVTERAVSGNAGSLPRELGVNTRSGCLCNGLPLCLRS